MKPPGTARPASRVRLVALAAALAGCRSAPPPPARVVVAPVPASPASQSARDAASEHFYRGKSLALAGEADCARLEFLEALETFRQGSQADDPDDLLFAGQLWESVRLYQPLTDKSESSDRPPAEDPRDSLVATAPASTPEEVETAKREVAAGPARLTFDIPVVVNEPVLKAVAFYQFRTPQAFAGALKRSGRYLALMRSILKDEGLPEDLVYVAMVESAFKHSAHSRAAAHGFWQFIAGTGRRYGLRKTHAYDERSDPIKSTRAAARYFRDLYEMFGDWHLVMAAYDAGEGKILRGLQRTGARDYWELRSGGMFLHRETRDYVPYVLAAALISKDPDRFGFDVVPDPPMRWETVRVTKPVDLARVAEAAGAQLAELRALNSELTTRFTPHGVGAYELRVPPGSPPLLEARLGSLPAAPDVAEKRVIVKRGDTLQKVAARAGVTVAELRDFNDLPGNAKLRKGTVLVVPARHPAKATRQPAAVAKAPEAAVPAAEAASIAPPLQGEIRALPTTASRITQPSDVGPFASTASSAPPPAPARKVEIPAEGFVDEPAAPARKHVQYQVRPGDTLYRIAMKYRTSVDTLRRVNAMDPDDRLRVGQRLTVR